MSVPKESFWRRRVLSPIAHQLTQGITPEKIALTLAVGSACALFPIVGTTTLLCLVAGIALRLNQPAIQLVNGICTPLHLPVIFGLYHLGNVLFGAHPISHRGGMRFFFTEMFGMLWDHPAEFFQQFGHLVVHLVVAWAVVAPFWIILVYVIALPVMREVDFLRRQPCS